MGGGGIQWEGSKGTDAGMPCAEEGAPGPSFVHKKVSLALALGPAPGIFTSEGCPVVR